MHEPIEPAPTMPILVSDERNVRLGVEGWGVLTFVNGLLIVRVSE